MIDGLPPLQFDQGQFWLVLGTAFASLGAFARWSFGQLFRRVDDSLEAFKTGLKDMCNTSNNAVSVFREEIKTCHDSHQRLLDVIVDLSKREKK